MNEYPIFLPHGWCTVHDAQDCHSGCPYREKTADHGEFYAIVAEQLRKWPDMPRDYTCSCGLYVHPDSPDLNPAAFHISDCPYYVAP